MSLQVSAIVHAEQQSESNKANAKVDNAREWFQKQPRFLRELAAGGIAGGSAKTCVAPLERTKILFQTGKIHGVGVPKTLMTIFETEGFPGLFKGNGASVLRIVPYAAIHFSCYEYFRRVLLEHCFPAVNRFQTPYIADSDGATASLVTACMSTEIKAPPLGITDEESTKSLTDDAQRRTTGAGCSSSGASERRNSALGPGGRGRLVVHPVWDLLAGSSAGAAAVLVTYPLDLARTRLACSTEGYGGVGKRQISPSSTYNPLASRVEASVSSPPQEASVPCQQRKTPQHITIRSTLVNTVKAKGILGLYHGVHPTLLGILPYAGLKFYCYQSFKNAYVAQQHQISDAEGVEPKLKPPVHLSLLFGGVSGLFAQTVTYPVDVVRRRMQIQGLLDERTAVNAAAGEGDAIAGNSLLNRKLPGTKDTIRMVFREEGWRGFFRGLSINYMKVVPSTAVGFTLYDHLKTYLGLDSSL